MSLLQLSSASLNQVLQLHSDIQCSNTEATFPLPTSLLFSYSLAFSPATPTQQCVSKVLVSLIILLPCPLSGTEVFFLTLGFSVLSQRSKTARLVFILKGRNYTSVPEKSSPLISTCLKMSLRQRTGLDQVLLGCFSYGKGSFPHHRSGWFVLMKT